MNTLHHGRSRNTQHATRNTFCAPRFNVLTSQRFNAFTLVEMLVVIAIIGILASMILAVFPAIKKKAQITKSKQEIQNIVAAIYSYEHDYSQFPSSKAAKGVAALTPPDDFTFGTTNVSCLNPGGQTNTAEGFSTPNGLKTIRAPGNYQANNSELIAILMDLEAFPNSAPTLNAGHVKNTNRTKYLSAPTVTGNISSGVGSDGVYRDPWGNPYIITLDLDSCQKTRDPLYRLPAVSADQADSNNPKRGLNGLFYNADNNYKCYQNNTEVMVWSAGPDRLIDQNTPANFGANKDNVVSWK